jgi:hypothetical protein
MKTLLDKYPVDKYRVAMLDCMMPLFADIVTDLHMNADRFPDDDKAYYDVMNNGISILLEGRHHGVLEGILYDCHFEEFLKESIH